MPRLKPSDAERARQDFCKLVGKKQIDVNIDTKEQLAKKISMKPQTLSRRLKDPGKFELSELRLLVKALNCTPDEVLQLVCGK